MAIICPTVLASEPHEFREQMERIAHFAQRIQIDLCDGIFTQTKTIALDQIWWPHSIPADIHLMYQRPDLYLDQILELKPSMVIVHAEAEGTFVPFAEAMHANGIKVGVAILQETKPESLKPAISHIDHVLIFAGSLGHFGGEADLGQLSKAETLKKMKSEIEIGWDGGVNESNSAVLADGGVDVLNVGGYIQKAEDPKAAYDKLSSVVGQVSNDTKTKS